IWLRATPGGRSLTLAAASSVSPAWSSPPASRLPCPVTSSRASSGRSRRRGRRCFDRCRGGSRFRWTRARAPTWRIRTRSSDAVPRETVPSMEGIRLIRVVVVAAYASVRAGLQVLLADLEECAVQGEARGSAELEGLLPELQPNVVLFDDNEDDRAR